MNDVVSSTLVQGSELDSQINGGLELYSKM